MCHKKTFWLNISRYFKLGLRAPHVTIRVFRFHEPVQLCASSYHERLKEWVPKIKYWLAQGLDVYAYFNNDNFGHALDDATFLNKLLRLAGSVFYPNLRLAKKTK